MRRALIVLTAVAAVVLVPSLQPTTASAVPVAPLCTPDANRGGVPPGFLLDACADATSMTVRNDLDVPVLVRRSGDVGVPARVHERGSAEATVLGLLSDTDELLMPGDVVRWPLGAAAGTLTVVDLDPAVGGIVHALRDDLPPLGGEDSDPETFAAVAAVVQETAAAVADRQACAADKNFLQLAACDVLTASTVSRGVIGQLPRDRAAELLPTVLDPANWADWVAPRPTDMSAIGIARRTLTQAAVPSPVPPPEPDPAAVAPTPVSAAIPEPAVPVPAVPAPVAAAAPVPQPAAVPAARPAIPDWLAEILARLAAEKNGNGQRNGDGADNGDGDGNGNGRGNGRGHD
ncbi:hypothetical protein [Blastococcus sp. CT_GayMR16]|uniref:hypothetical protein n=1 Tax=Blastococcus sp. CT_GayMR16 TaxID=2559607 RepID=UPI0010748FB9|nr:hypothetical protein [Blastococcus sp. CT_GayMR16]TFV89888.1 hypothetical protein E4P38_05385 [Blastococcus sp. CT_GayMR16]